MKRLYVLLILMLSPLLALAATTPATSTVKATPTAVTQSTPIVPLDRVVAVVNSQVITQSQLNEALTPIRQHLSASKTPLPPANELEKQVLNQLIIAKIQQQMATRNNITVSSSDVSNAIKGIAKRNNISMAELKSKLEASGADYAKYRKGVREQMLLSKVEHSDVGDKVNVTDQDVSNFIQQYQKQVKSGKEYNVADILIPLPGTPSPKQVDAAQKTADSIVAKLNKGANFSQVAAGQSGGQQALQGGGLGWRKLAELPTIFANQVHNMKTNSIAGPLRAPNGFHIIKLLGVKDSGQKFTRNQIRGMLAERQYQQQLEIWLQRMRAASYVKIMLG